MLSISDSEKTVPGQFVLMVKPVGSSCNLRCGYCYYLDTAEVNDKELRPRMSDEVLEALIRQYIEAGPGPVVSFTWHGGEPVLAGLEFYRTAVKLQAKYLPEGWSCWNSLQTNGTLLDDEWCVFLKENNFDVGLSLDGERWLHDKYRKDAAGNGTFDKVHAAAGLLQSYGIQPDLLCTVTAAAAKEPLSVYKSLRSLGTGWIQFIPIVRRTPEGGVSADTVSGEAYGRFLCEIFDEWILRDIGRTNVQIFAETALMLSGGSTSLCSMSLVCGRALVAEQDGDIYSCDHFVTPEHRIGNIADTDLRQLADSGMQEYFGMKKLKQLQLKCLECSYLQLCGGGCPKDRFSSDIHGNEDLNYLCDGLFSFFERAQDPLQQLAAMRKSGLSAAAASSKFREQAAAEWKGIRRDDPCPCGSGRKAKQCCWHKRVQLNEL